MNQGIPSIIFAGCKHQHFQHLQLVESWHGTPTVTVFVAWTLWAGVQFQTGSWHLHPLCSRCIIALYSKLLIFQTWVSPNIVETRIILNFPWDKFWNHHDINRSTTEPRRCFPMSFPVPRPRHPGAVGHGLGLSEDPGGRVRGHVDPRLQTVFLTKKQTKTLLNPNKIYGIYETSWVYICLYGWKWKS